MKALGLEFLGPQAPHGRRASGPPVDVPEDTKNVPTFYRSGGPEAAVNQLDYVFASRGFHEKVVSVRAMNGVEEWGPSESLPPDDRGEDRRRGLTERSGQSFGDP